MYDVLQSLSISHVWENNIYTLNIYLNYTLALLIFKIFIQILSVGVSLIRKFR